MTAHLSHADTPPRSSWQNRDSDGSREMNNEEFVRHAKAGAGSRYKRQAIPECEAEVAAINAHLSHLATGATPARSRRDPPRD